MVGDGNGVVDDGEVEEGGEGGGGGVLPEEEDQPHLLPLASLLGRLAVLKTPIQTCTKIVMLTLVIGLDCLKNSSQVSCWKRALTAKSLSRSCVPIIVR